MISVKYPKELVLSQSRLGIINHLSLSLSVKALESVQSLYYNPKVINKRLFHKFRQHHFSVKNKTIK